MSDHECTLGFMARRRPAAVLAFTDGACSGNPGPAGIGVVLVCGNHRREISEYIGEATGNIAELSAVVRALSAITDRGRHVILHSDSEYAIGALTRNWRIRANKTVGSHEDGTLVSQEHSPLGSCRRMTLISCPIPPSSVQRWWRETSA